VFVREVFAGARSSVPFHIDKENAMHKQMQELTRAEVGCVAGGDGATIEISTSDPSWLQIITGWFQSSDNVVVPATIATVGIRG
jgi:hypothetical protein